MNLQELIANTEKLTFIFIKDKDGYTGICKEIGEIVTEGDTIPECIKNLAIQIEMVNEIKQK